MKEKRGFTLIELLAVIVILAIIALIATPIVLGLISKARQGAAEDTAYGIRKESQILYQTTLMENAEVFTKIEVDFTKTMTKDGKTYPETKIFTATHPEGVLANTPFEVDGTLPTNGKVIISGNGTIDYQNIVINGYGCNVPSNGKITCGEDEVVEEEPNIGISGSEAAGTTPSGNEQGGTTPSGEDEVVEEEPNIGISGSEAAGTTPSGNEQGGTDPNDVIIGDGTDPYGYSTASYGYDPNDLTTISTTRPSDRKAYLRYPLTNGKIAAGTMPDTCLNIEKYGGELCLKYNDYEGPEGTRQKVLDYFKWDENTSTSQYSDVTCTINAKYVRCNDSHVQEGRAETRTNTEIRAIDYAGGVSHGCGINSYGIVTCSYD